ncbi:MAG: hypothetical protein IT363_07645 [Methanoregulaceae archaeon]|nr:hypothetical protein [Methanoregulaceae archaeon]
MEIGWINRGFAAGVMLSLGGLSIAGFNPSEKERILAYWNEPGRYEARQPESLKQPWAVRYTPEGSLWLWAYNNKRGYGKIFVVPAPRNEREKQWEDWIEAKIAYDKWLATRAANAANAELGLKPEAIGPEPNLPGPIPETLRMMVGDAPEFVLAVQPKQHDVVFHDGIKISLVDNPAMKHRYPYYRAAEGVMHGGTPLSRMPEKDIDELFKAAGISPSARKVMNAVSRLEGGFDSVNTYDTGYVSVGFIQFACLSRGAGSLGAVLLRQKQANVEAFESDFRSYGLDVKEDGTLVVLNLEDGQETEGFFAAKQIIKDKRLIAVFQRAGRLSKPFKIAQLQEAKAQYFPDEEQFPIKLGGQTLNVRVADLVRSEAGLATIMDRKVNLGKIHPLPSVAQQVADTYGLKSLDQLAKYEREIVEGVRFRKDYLQDGSLSQPAAVPAAPRNKPSPSRKTTRRGRGS